MKGPVQPRPDPFVSAPPIFPGRRQPSIFGASELNCRVRDGNGWTLTAISTDFVNTSSISFAVSPLPRRHPLRRTLLGLEGAYLMRSFYFNRSRG